MRESWLKTQGLGATGRQLRNVFSSPTAKIGGTLLLFQLVMLMAAVTWQPTGTAISSNFLAPPSVSEPLGTDHLGRSVLERVVAGSPNVLGVSLASALTAVLLGVTLGGLLAYRGGILDLVVMRLVDLLLSFPLILAALLGAAILPRGYLSLYAIVVAVLTPGVTRVSRAIVADTLSRDFVTTAVLRGEAMSSILVREVLPSATGPLLVEFAIRWNLALLLIASLNFLGVGVQPPTADWGLMIFEARAQLTIAPWIAVVPAIALASLAVAINFSADGLSLALTRRHTPGRVLR